MSVRELASRYSATQRRTIGAAAALFAKHGVGGTSLQMIADAVGVAKAAIYYQFKTKEAILLAVLEVDLQPVEAALEGAEAAGRSLRAREALLARVIDGAVEHRRRVGPMLGDPVFVRLLDEYEPSRRLWARLFSVLLGDELGVQARVRGAVLSAAIGGAVSHAFVADVDDETLRAELLRVTRPLLRPPA